MQKNDACFFKRLLRPKPHSVNQIKQQKACLKNWANKAFKIQDVGEKKVLRYAIIEKGGRGVNIASEMLLSEVSTDANAIY